MYLSSHERRRSNRQIVRKPKNGRKPRGKVSRKKERGRILLSSVQKIKIGLSGGERNDYQKIQVISILLNPQASKRPELKKKKRENISTTTNSLKTRHVLESHRWKGEVAAIFLFGEKEKKVGTLKPESRGLRRKPQQKRLGEKKKSPEERRPCLLSEREQRAPPCPRKAST